MNLEKCSIHGKPTKRSQCNLCNSAYQRGYLKRRRLALPEREMWRRARERARVQGISFSITDNLAIPDRCPVLGLALTAGGTRSPTSPSLDRIDPTLGYVPGNVRVISDHANRMKGNRSLDDLRRLARSGAKKHRASYEQIVAYVDREALLAEVRRKALASGKLGEEWRKLALFLDKAFQKGCR